MEERSAERMKGKSEEEGRMEKKGKSGEKRERVEGKVKENRRK